MDGVLTVEGWLGIAQRLLWLGRSLNQVTIADHVAVNLNRLRQVKSNW